MITEKAYEDFVLSLFSSAEKGMPLKNDGMCQEDVRACMELMLMAPTYKKCWEELNESTKLSFQNLCEMLSKGSAHPLSISVAPAPSVENKKKRRIRIKKPVSLSDFLSKKFPQNKETQK